MLKLERLSNDVLLDRAVPLIQFQVSINTLVKWFVPLDPIAVPNSNLDHWKKKAKVTHKKSLWPLIFNLSNYLYFMKELHQSFDVMLIIITLCLPQKKTYEPLSKSTLTKTLHKRSPLIGLALVLVTSICKNAVCRSCTLLLLMYSC